MYNQLIDYFRDPEDSDPTFVGLVRNIIAYSMLATVFSMIVVALGTDTPGFLFATPASLLISVVVEIYALLRARQGRLLAAKIIVPFVLTVAVTIVALSGHGLHDVSIMAYPLIIMIATLLQSRRSFYFTMPMVMIAICVLGGADMLGLTSTPVANRTSLWIIAICLALVVAGAAVLNLLVQRLKNAVAIAQAKDVAQQEAITELSLLQESLEKRVTERTTELETASQRNEKRARQFEAISEVARAITVTQNLETLLFALTDLIGNQFGFDHTGIFLVDENREFAVLRAANSEGGKQMLAREHKLRIGQSGIVGYVSASGKARIALDVGADATFFNNPDLPDTRSEMALPLRIADRVIGVLDIQSNNPNAFAEEDIEVLSTLADQATIAIQNAQSYEITQILLAKAQQSSGAFLHESWRVLQPQDQNAGYQVFDNKLQVLSRTIPSNHAQKAIINRQTVKEDGEGAVLAIPIRIREEVIGVMDIRVPDEHEWDEDELDIAEAVAERLSLALESSLLLKATQRRAEIERVTADISTRIGASSQFDAILRTAAEELSRALGGSEVLVQINRDTFDK